MLNPFDNFQQAFENRYFSSLVIYIGIYIYIYSYNNYSVYIIIDFIPNFILLPEGLCVNKSTLSFKNNTLLLRGFF